MKLETIHEEWDKDQFFDPAKPDEIVRNIPLLHAKYWRIYGTEKVTFLSVKQEYDQLRLAKLEWYTGRMEDKDRVARGWPLQQLRLVRQEVENYLDADADLTNLKTRMELQEHKLKFLEDIIKSIHGRNFLINTYVNYLKYSQGAG